MGSKINNLTAKHMRQRAKVHVDQSKEPQETVWMPCADCSTPVQCTEIEECYREVSDG